MSLATSMGRCFRSQFAMFQLQLQSASSCRMSLQSTGEATCGGEKVMKMEVEKIPTREKEKEKTKEKPRQKLRKATRRTRLRLMARRRMA